jgi:cytochrome o ubiquinol oxidase subunit IV
MRRDTATYAVGFALAVLLTGAAFASVAFGHLSRTTRDAIIAGTAIAQVLVHFRCFLHIDLSKSKRDDLQLILFSTMIVVIMVGGTLWIVLNQKMRMM